MNTKKPKRPIYLLSPRRLRREYQLSWWKIRRAVDQGHVVPFAANGDNQGDPFFFHYDQLDELKATCAATPRQRWAK